MIPGGGGLFQQSLLSTGQKPETTSIKNRVPTPKPGTKTKHNE